MRNVAAIIFRCAPVVVVKHPIRVKLKMKVASVGIEGGL
jgi:hypothetical protein